MYIYIYIYIYIYLLNTEMKIVEVQIKLECIKSYCNNIELDKHILNKKGKYLIYNIFQYIIN